MIFEKLTVDIRQSSKQHVCLKVIASTECKQLKEFCFTMERYCTELQEEKTFCQIFQIIFVNSLSVVRMRDRNRARDFIGERNKTKQQNKTKFLQ